MELEIQGKTALVTASSQGIGKAISCALAKEGMNVISCSRSIDRLEKAKQEIHNETKREVHTRLVDLSSIASVKRLMKELKTDFGNIDALVYNTGGPKIGGFFDLGPRDWDNSYNLILRSYQTMLHHLLPYMIRERWGRVIVIGSLSAKQTASQLVASNTFRPAVLGLNKSLSHEFANNGITFNTICPSGIVSQRLETLIEKRANTNNRTYEEEMKAYIDDIPSGRLGSPHEVANFVSFLVSNKASFITGGCFGIDGGSMKSIF